MIDLPSDEYMHENGVGLGVAKTNSSKSMKGNEATRIFDEQNTHLCTEENVSL